MTDQSPPAGWYPDPADPNRTRWWDGSSWAAQVPQQSAAGTSPSSGPGPYPGGYAAGGAPAGYGTPPRVDADPNTTWIWLIIGISAIAPFAVLLFDFSGFFERVLSFVQEYPSGQPSQEETMRFVSQVMANMMGTVSVLMLLSLAMTVAYIVFAYLDWKTLRERGVVEPFHWAFAFFVLLLGSMIVYIIGRSVVVYNRTGKGLTPLWVWIAASVVSIFVSSSILLAQLLPLMEEIARVAG